jgi:hypothetical protein
MKLFEIPAASSAELSDDGRYRSDGHITYAPPDEAIDALAPVLEPYDADPAWYLDQINHGRGPAPWAFVCLDREYDLAAHVDQARDGVGGIFFAQYTRPTYPPPDDFIPRVGTLVLMRKDSLEAAQGRSPLLDAAWDQLQDCSPDATWLLILDTPDPEWVRTEEARNAQRWHAR